MENEATPNTGLPSREASSSYPAAQFRLVSLFIKELSATLWHGYFACNPNLPGAAHDRIQFQFVYSQSIRIEAEKGRTLN